MDLNMGRMIFAQNFYRQSRQSRQPNREVEKLSRLQQDYSASSLRLQLNTLNNMLSSVENSDKYDVGYLQESMRRIEKNMHCLRKVWSN